MGRTRLGHAHLKVTNLDRAVAFYTRHFELKVVEILGDQYAFLSRGELHHDIALQAVGAGAPRPSRYSIGLFHVAFEVPDKHAFALAFQNLIEAGIKVVPVDHQISWSLYFVDPDDNGLEIYVDTRDENGGTRLWNGQDRPLSTQSVLAHLA